MFNLLQDVEAIKHPVDKGCPTTQYDLQTVAVEFDVELAKFSALNALGQTREVAAANE